MPSLQNSGPGGKSSKFQGLNPFTPFLAQPGDFDGNDNHDSTPEDSLAENLDSRLRVSQGSRMSTQPPSQYSMSQTMEQQTSSFPSNTTTTPTPSSSLGVSGPVVKPLFNKSDETKEIDKTASNSDDDDDSDLDEYDDDDEALEAFRQRRLAELQKEHNVMSEQKAQGHGEVRTIVQDEFLPECTGSSQFVCVHFFHDDFERCKIMDQHLQRIATCHMKCKFVRINAEKAPFFVTKLSIQTLPTLLVFKDGKLMDRLLGFEGLSDTKYPDQFPTSRLGRWLEKTGAIEYEGPDSDDDDEEGTSRRTSPRRDMFSSRVNEYDDDED